VGLTYAATLRRKPRGPRKTSGATARWQGLARGWVFAMALCSPPRALADRAAEIARIHVEAIGGMARIEALRAMRMTGSAVTATGSRVPIVLVAARPARLRIESTFGARKIVQGSDGVNPPWHYDSDTATAVALSADLAQRFLADADFDDPLVRWAERGYQLQFAGDKDVEGRRLLGVLVARTLTENVVILLDPQTYFIVLRVQRMGSPDAPVEVVTHYDDYRPVGGVLVAHRVTLFEAGRQTQQAHFTAIESNPPLNNSLFARPAGRASQ
jgi:hypothetical protein